MQITRHQPEKSDFRAIASMQPAGKRLLRRVTARVTSNRMFMTQVVGPDSSESERLAR